MASSTKRSWKLQEYVAHSNNVKCLAIGQKSGRVMVTGGEDKKVNMWAVGKPNCIMSLSGHTSSIEAVRFGQSEEMVVAGSASGALKIWDLEAAKIVRTLTGHNDSIKCIDFHPLADFVASGSDDTNIKLWDIRRKGCLYTYKGHKKRVNALRFSPDSRWLVSAGEDGVIKLWDLSAGKLLADLTHHKAAVNSVEFHPNEFLLASGSHDRTVKFWDLERFDMVSSTDGDCGPVRSIFFHPEGSCLFAGSDNLMKVYGWEPARCFDTVPLGWDQVKGISIAHSTKQSQLIGASINGANVSTYVVDLQKVQPVGDAPDPTSPPHHLKQSGRKSFVTERSAKEEEPKEDPQESHSPQEEPNDDNNAEIQDPINYKNIFQPKQRLAHSPPKADEPFQAPSDDGYPEPDPPRIIKSSAPPSNKPSSHISNNSPDIDYSHFLPKKPVPNSEGVSGEEDALSAVSRGHSSIVAVMSNRHRNLQIVRALWSGGNIKTALDSAVNMADQAVMVDLCNILVKKSSVWNLDIVLTVLPQIASILVSKYDNYVQTGCSCLRLIMKNFSSVIKANLMAPPSSGVDISREDRYKKCKACYSELMKVRSIVASKQQVPGRPGATFRELHLLMNMLE